MISRAATAAFVMLMLAGSGTHAADEGTAAAVLKLLPPLLLAPALTQACAAREPIKRDFYAGLLIAWRQRNHAQAYEQSISALLARSPAAAALMADVKAKAQAAARTMTMQNVETCAQLSGLLAGASLSLGTNAAAAKAVIDAQIGGLPGGQAAPARALTLYSVGQLSALAQLAGAGGAKGNDGLKTATALLGRLGTVAVTGQVIPGNHALQQVETERQSIMHVACFSYGQPHGEEALTALGGQTVTLAGRITEVWSARNMRMDDCRIVSGITGLDKATVDDAAGFEMRPLTQQEALAGANQGIASADVSDVLYRFTSSASIDGFGNGYVERHEDTYVLLKDGTAFRHHWPFPFQDLNLTLEKRREPDNLFEWRRDGGNFVLTHTAGSSAGTSVSLQADTELRPLPQGASIDHSYFFLDVGSGGLTRRRNYRFGADGILSMDRSSLVAAKTAPGAGGVTVSTPGTTFTGGGSQNGFIASAGSSSQEALRYRIDGYVIELTHADGSVERQSIGLMAGEALPPENLYLGGQTLWTK